MTLTFTVRNYELFIVYMDGAYVQYDGADATHVAYVEGNGTVYEQISAITNFITGSDLDTIELALELLKTDEKGTPLKDANGDYMALGGIYLYQGDLYLDGTSLFDVASNYTKIPNFVDMLMGLIFGDGTSATATSAGDGEAMASAEVEADVERDAVIALVLSDTAGQILITKSIISLIIGALLPDLGSIEEIFNKLEVSVGAEIGSYGYNRFFDDGDEVDELEVLNDIYSGTRYFVESVSANASGDYYKQTVNGRDYYLYITDGVAVPAGAERFDVTFSPSQVSADAYLTLHLMHYCPE